MRNMQIEVTYNKKMWPCYLGPLVTISRNCGGAYILCKLDWFSIDQQQHFAWSYIQHKNKLLSLVTFWTLTLLDYISLKKQNCQTIKACQTLLAMTNKIAILLYFTFSNLFLHITYLSLVYQICYTFSSLHFKRYSLSNNCSSVLAQTKGISCHVDLLSVSPISLSFFCFLFFLL